MSNMDHQLLRQKLVKISQNLSNEHKKTLVSRKIVCFGILIHTHFVLKTKEKPVYMFSLLRFLTNF